MYWGVGKISICQGENCGSNWKFLQLLWGGKMLPIPVFLDCFSCSCFPFFGSPPSLLGLQNVNLGELGQDPMCVESTGLLSCNIPSSTSWALPCWLETQTSLRNNECNTLGWSSKTRYFLYWKHPAKVLSPIKHLSQDCSLFSSSDIKMTVHNRQPLSCHFLS